MNNKSGFPYIQTKQKGKKPFKSFLRFYMEMHAPAWMPFVDRLFVVGNVSFRIKTQRLTGLTVRYKSSASSLGLFLSSLIINLD